MSKSKESNPDAPKRTPSSQGLFSSLRTLTSPKGQQGSPDVSVAPNSDIVAGWEAGTANKAGGEPTEANTPVAAVESEPATANDRGIDAKVDTVGGPRDLQMLVDTLGSRGDVHARIAAAHQIEKTLKRYPVDNVTGIWEAGKDLTRIKDIEGAEQAGYSLLRACVKWKTLSPAERKYFFQFIGQDLPESDDAYKLQLLIELTNNGKYIESLEQLVVPVWQELFHESFSAAKKARQQNRNAPDTEEPVQEVYLQQAFDFTNDLVKYNSKVLSDEHRTTILDEVNKVCMTATRHPEINSAFAIYKTFLTYSSYTEASLHYCLEVFCAVIATYPSRKEDAVYLVQSLLQSHLGSFIPPLLLTILANGSVVHNTNLGIYRGALYALRHLLCDENWVNVPKASLDEIVLAAEGYLQKRSASFTNEFKQLLLGAIADQSSREQIFMGPTWGRITGLLITYAPRRAASLVLNEDGGGKEDDSKNLDANFMIDAIRQFSKGLIELCEHENFEYKRKSIKFMLQIVHCLQDDLARRIVILSSQHLLSPRDPDWIMTGKQTFTSIVQPSRRVDSVRMDALRNLYDSYSTGQALNIPHSSAFILHVLDGIREEFHPLVMTELCTIAVEVSTSATDYNGFERILSALRAAILEQDIVPTGGLLQVAQSSKEDPDTRETIAARTLVRLFLRNLRRSAWKIQRIYSVLLEVVQADTAALARLIVLKLLFRLRADVNHAIFVAPKTDSEGVASALYRTAESDLTSPKPSESPLSRPTRPEDQAAKRQNQSMPDRTGQPSRSRSNASRAPAAGSRVTRPPPLWMYPGPKGLPEDPPHEASDVVFSHHDFDRETGEQSSSSFLALESSRLLEVVITLLQQDELDWEIYSYVVVHLGAQLTNHSLFVDAIPQIKLLRSVVCSQVSNKTFHEPPSYTNLRRTDVTVCLYHILTMLVSYHDHFSRNENDELVKMFVLGISSWERTSEACIHALSICCHELPMSLVKNLQQALQNMSQILAQTHIAVHVLEFLTGLARLPNLFSNFRDEEFRMVFGICFRYLQIVRDAKEKELSGNEVRSGRAMATALRGSRELPPAAESTPTKTLADELPQYVYALAYHVMVFWFMGLEMNDRPGKLTWIIDQLVLKDRSGNRYVEQQSQVTIDLMYNIAYSARDDTVYIPNFAKPIDGIVTKKTWLVGLSILTIETAGRTGLSQVTRRRSANTRHYTYRPQLLNIPNYHIAASEEARRAFYDENFIGIKPDDLLQENYASIIAMDMNLINSLPMEIPQDDSTERALAAFDRISYVDGHKIGIIYIGENQTDEATILGNVMGSADYDAFLNGIGTATPLRGATFNTQGLDRSNDLDGKYTYCWRDRVSEIVFHVTTLMPTDREHDPQSTQKKRHTGNDFVKIIFNNSGLPFEFDTFPSDFNLVNIVITPEARSSFIETRRHTAHATGPQYAPKEEGVPQPERESFFRVQVMTKRGVPAISAASETKIVSAGSLPVFVRLLALNASVFSQVWSNRASGEHVSSWRSRLREILRLRERYPRPPPPGTPATTQTAEMGSQPSVATPSSITYKPSTSYHASQPSKESGLLRRASAATFFSDATNRTSRSSGLSGTTDAPSYDPKSTGE